MQHVWAQSRQNECFIPTGSFWSSIPKEQGNVTAQRIKRWKTENIKSQTTEQFHSEMCWFSWALQSCLVISASTEKCTCTPLQGKSRAHLEKHICWEEPLGKMAVWPAVTCSFAACQRDREEQPRGKGVMCREQSYSCHLRRGAGRPWLTHSGSVLLLPLLMGDRGLLVGTSPS